MLLNLENYDLPTIFESIVENLVITDQIKFSMREKVKEILLSKHCHHHQNKPGLLRRKPSTVSLASSAGRWLILKSDTKIHLIRLFHVVSNLIPIKIVRLKDNADCEFAFHA